MRINQHFWEIETAGWAIDQSPECVTLNPYDTGAALQISCHRKLTGTVTDGELLGFAKDVLAEHDVAPSPVVCGDFHGFHGAFIDGEPRFWRHWFLATGCVSLYITYNTAPKEAAAHTAVVDWMLSGLRAFDTDPTPAQ